MKRRTFIQASAALALLPGAALAALSDQDQADLRRIETYLNDLKGLTADFLQVAPDGSLSQGKLFLRRPGRVRFQYDPPSPILVVSDGVSLVYWDAKLKQIERVPLIATPLSIFLSDPVKLSGDIGVKKIERAPGVLRVTLFDTKKAKDGQITLVFSDRPFILKQWDVTDQRGETTTIALSNVDPTVVPAGQMFIIGEKGPSEQTR